MGIVIFSMLTLVSMAAGIPPAVAQNTDPQNNYSPYTSVSSKYYNGATYDVPRNKAMIDKDLDYMKKVFINTVNVYNIMDLDSNIRDYLFDALKKRDMKIVVRLESYDAGTYCFRADTDVKWVLDYYKDLIAYASSEARYRTVCYYAINVPCDDPRIQNNIRTRLINEKKLTADANPMQALNCDISKKYQQEYVSSFVRQLRAQIHPESKIFAGVFYGWNGDIDQGSLIDTGIDGIFLNVYSYPIAAVPGSDGVLHDESAAGDSLIQAKQLAITMKHCEEQYPDLPKVIEWGYHTADILIHKIPAQTAGLVKNRAAKLKAMQATVRFYQQYDSVVGNMYFTFNISKNEGDDNGMMDWGIYDQIVVTQTPDYGQKGVLTGWVQGINPGDFGEYGIVVYAKTGDKWFSLPAGKKEPVLKIASNGGWKLDLNTDAELNATDFRIYLMPLSDRIRVAKGSDDLPMILNYYYNIQIKRK
jgi:hypothetical protein